jgi:8-oxo-dGTP pyrophosphatase MutT (NUDIX family)
MENPWQTIDNQEVYRNPWIHVTHRQIINPAGNPGIYGVVHFHNLAIGVVPLDEEGYTWLVGQYRYTLDQYSWEIPEGGCPIGTSSLETAKRELLEETGISAQKWTKLLDFHTSNSVTDEAGTVFLAQDLSFGESAPEDTEDITVKKVKFSEALAMVLDGRITDALSIMALFRVKMWMDEQGQS